MIIITRFLFSVYKDS